jgi:hypothetical protein
MLESCYISLRPIRWSQEIRWYPSINVEGRHLRATCTTTDDLLLSDGQKLRDFEIELSIMDGELDPETRAKSKLQEAAIGGIWWISDHPSLVHGRFYLKSDARAAIWDQVRAGGYVDCRITLSVTPVRLKASSFAMDGNPFRRKCGCSIHAQANCRETCEPRRAKSGVGQEALGRSPPFSIGNCLAVSNMERDFRWIISNDDWRGQDNCNSVVCCRIAALVFGSTKTVQRPMTSQRRPVVRFSSWAGVGGQG